MKNALMILSALAATSVFAVTEVQSENTFGFVEAAGGNGTTRSLIMVAVPVTGYGNTSSAISIADILQTSNLAEGDELYTLAANGTYNKYTLNSDKTAWTAAAKAVMIGANGDAVPTDTDSAMTATIARGQAFWLKTAATIVYLMGEATTGKAGVAVEGQAVTGKWNLIGNSSMTQAVKISEIAGTKGDIIQVVDNTGVAKRYVCGGGMTWKLYTPNGPSKYTDVADTDVINVGQGFMYQAKANKTISEL